MGTLVTNIFGNLSSDAITHVTTNVSIGQTITAIQWSTLRNAISAERGRRGLSTTGWETVNNSVGGLITAADFNQFISGVTVSPLALGTGGFQDRYTHQTNAFYYNVFNNDATEPSAVGVGDRAGDSQDFLNTTIPVVFPTTGAPTGISSVSVGATIFAATYNSLNTKITNASTVCVCNCNYCACNCNYCTCDCNYSCTCNCNYSDERLKEEIKILKTVHGLNLYTWKYIWNKTKYVGVLAQELIGTKYESALTQDENGYYMVDYSVLPVDMTLYKET